jgi:four helix bundle protein
MHNYWELKIWQHARELVKEVYLLTGNFPQNQQYGITSQMQRAVISIPSNIAEGAGRNSEKEFIHFLDIAIGSAFELETQLYLSADLGFSNLENSSSLISNLKDLQKMIIKFRQSIENRKHKE